MKNYQTLLYIILFNFLFLHGIAKDRHFVFLQESHLFSDEEVNAICKDINGVLWVGTSNGLNCFDGYEITSFYHDETVKNSLPDNHIIGISLAPNNMLLITTTRGYAFFDPIKRCVINNFDLEVYPKMVSMDAIQQLYSDTDNIWFSFQGAKNIKRYSYVSKRLYTYPFAKEDGYIIDKSIDHQVFLTSNGRVLSLVDTALIIKADFSNLRVSSNQAKLYVDKKGVYYYYQPGKSGVLRYIPSSKRYDTILNEYIINDLCLDHDGALWVATDHTGVIIVNPNSEIENYQTSIELFNSIPHNNVLCLFQDTQYVMWLGGYKRGVSYHINMQADYVNNYLSTLGDLSYIPDVTAVMPIKSGCWLATNEHGLLFYSQLQHKVVKEYNTHTMPSISSNVVVSLCEGAKKSLWIGQFWGGLACLKNGEVIQYHHIPGNSNSLSCENVWDIYRDENNLLWIATLGGGLQSFDPVKKRFKTYRMEQYAMLPSNGLYSICPGPNDVLYIGTSNGVCAFHRYTETFEYIGDARFKAHMMNRSDVIQVYYDSRGLLWMLTRTQLYVYDTKQKKLIDLPFLKERTHLKFSSIAEDNEKRVCIVCADQIWLVTVSQRKNISSYSFNLRACGRSNYIQNKAFNQRSIALDHLGHFWIGGGKGVTCIDPKKMYDYTERVQVHLKDLFLKGQKVVPDSVYNGRTILSKPISELTTLTLNYNQNVFSISAYSDNILNTSEQQFEYWLSDVQEQWMPIKKGVDEVHLMNLKPGDYIFKLRLYDPTGYYKSNQVTMKIHINPPMWLTWWAYCLYIILLGALSIGVVWLVRHHLHQKYQILQLSYAAQKEKELTKLKLQFFTDISHEIRTPLSLILGPLQRCIQSNDLNSVKRQMGVMQQHGMYLMNLVNQILDYRKIDASGTKVNVKTHNFSEQILELIDKFEFAISQQEAELSLEGPQNLCCTYDSDLIEKILTNLLSNALKYGGQNVAIQLNYDIVVSENSSELPKLKISVVDNGPGISSEDQPYVFDRFFRNTDKVQSSTNVKGTGIGLYLVKKYVDALGGVITLSNNGHDKSGCVFEICIPVSVELQSSHIGSVRISSKQTAKMTTALSEVVAPVHNELILIVDDDNDFREYLLDTMRAYYHLESACNGVEAWDIIPTLMPDIIILDKMMPKMDGIQLCQFIKEDVRTAHIPVIMLTACMDDESKIEGLSLGADDYLSKPFDWDVLNLRIEYLLDKNRLQQEKFQYRAYVEPSRMNLSAADELFLTNALRYVQDHLKNEDLSVETLSNELGISRAHLYKKLIFITGKSPVEFIRLVRLKTAAHMLKNGEMNVSEVSYAVGFNTPKYFSKQFKEVYKVSPSAFIKGNG